MDEGRLGDHARTSVVGLEHLVLVHGHGPAQGLGPAPHLAPQVEAQGGHDGVVGGHLQALLAVLVGVAARDDLEALLVPLPGDLAAVVLAVQDQALPGAVDDLGVVVDREDARHDAAAVPVPLDHREGVAARPAHAQGLVADGRQAGGQRSPRNEVVEAIVGDAQPRAVGQLVREAPEPGVLSALGGQHVLEDARALAALLGPAQDRGRDARPAAHHAEGVADGQQGRVAVGADGVEQREEGLLPGAVLGDPLAALGDAVVAGGVEVPGTAGAEVEREASSGALGHAARPAHVEGQRPQPQAGLLESAAQVAGRVLHQVHQGVVAQVGPAVVHVEHGHVDLALVRRGQLLGPLDAPVLEDAARRVDRAVRDAELRAVGDLLVAGDRHLPKESSFRPRPRPPLPGRARRPAGAGIGSAP